MTAANGNAIVYCEGAFCTTNGKTAHGLVRRTTRYRLVAIVDSRSSGHDAGVLLDGNARGIPVVDDIHAAVDLGAGRGPPATHLVIGLAPDGGRLTRQARAHVLEAIDLGLNIDSGLHDFLSEDSELAKRAAERGVHLQDVRRTPPRSQLHPFSGKIQQVDCTRIAVLGTDSAVGKRTTAWTIVDGLMERGLRAEMIGTGQTAWMQGARYGIVLDALINDFVAGELEHAVWSAWHECRPDVLVIEGQGSLMNPAYPGGHEILAACRPDGIVLQHAPRRREYDGFPGYPIHPLSRQIEALELISGRPVIAITLNHENLPRAEYASVQGTLARQTGLPVFDVLWEGPQPLCSVLADWRSGTAPTTSIGSESHATA